MTTRTRGFRRVALLSAMLVAGVAASGSAQATAPAQRWDAWMGCWRAEVPVNLNGQSGSAPYVCVTPTDRVSAVEVLTIDGSKVLSRDTIDASGERRTATIQGCQASKVGQWSTDGRRVLTRSEVTCPDTKRTTTGMLAIGPSMEWLDIQSVTASGNTGIRVTRYHQARPAHPDSLPMSVQRQLDRGEAIGSARALAGGSLDVRDIAEASKLVDTSVVQAWIVERGARFKLNAASLEALANAGVPGSVTDVMVGVSYPEHFALQQPRMVGGAGDLSSLDSARVASEYLNGRCFNSIDPFLCGPRYSYGYGGLYGYGLYGYGLYGYNTYGGYGYPGYGYSGGYYGFYGAPIVVVKGDQQQPSHGQIVKGVGYTPGRSSGSGSSGGVSSSGYSGSSGSSGASAPTSSGSSSSGSSSSGSTSSGGGRTAIPRPPK